MISIVTTQQTVRLALAIFQIAALYSRFPSNPLIIKVLFSLMFSLLRRHQNEKAERVLLGYLVLEEIIIGSPKREVLASTPHVRLFAAFCKNDPAPSKKSTGKF